MKRPFTAPTKITLEGIDALTVLQAKALLKASLAAMIGANEGLTGRERESLSQAAAKLERSIRFSARD